MIHTLFPPVCVGCGSLGQPLCIRCALALPEVENDWCVRCKRLLPSTHNGCLYCRDNLESFPVFSFWYYEGIVPRALHAIKYNGEKELIGELISHISVRALGRFFEFLHHIPSPTFVPTPLHKHKQLERGFNQTLLMSRILSIITSIPVTENILYRVKNTHPQAQTRSRSERLTNISGAFELRNAGQISSKSIIIVDDVLTSGSTAREMIRVIKRHTSCPTYVVCFAREKPTT